MATLNEYYLKDFSRLLSAHKTSLIQDKNKNKYEIIEKIHFDFDSNVIFVSYFIPKLNNPLSLFKTLIDKIENTIKINDQNNVLTNFPGEDPFNSSDLKFSGRIFFYYEDIINENEFNQLKNILKSQGIFIHYRDINYSKERSKLEKPLAFISHDFRDKVEIASKIANGLQQRNCHVWYDEYSLKLGDSLRESIEKGLEECVKCILILSPNYLNNSGWTKTEFNTIFTREIIETKSLILPIWFGVTKQDIYNYCPILADRVAVNWEKGLDFVLRKIEQAVMSIK